MMDIQDLNIKMRDFALSYLPTTKQFEERFKGEDLDVYSIDTYTTKEVLLQGNGPTTWLEFKFEGNVCNVSTLVEVTFHTTAFDQEDFCFRYLAIDFENLYYTYIGS